MSFFTGQYVCKLDAKGRLTLPSKMKSKLPEVSGNQLVLSRGLEPCITLYPLVEYRKTYARIASLNEFNENSRWLQRNFFARIEETELDSAGRLLIPKPMLKHARLEKEVILIGAGNKMELWDAKVYDEANITSDAEFSKLAQKYLTE